MLTIKRQQLKGDIEAETGRLLAERSTQLDNLVKDKEKPLKQQEKLFIAAERHVGELRELELQLQNRLQGLHRDFSDRKRQVDALKVEYSELSKAVTEAERCKNDLEVTYDGLRNGIVQLEVFIPTLKEECAFLETRKVDLEAANQQFAADFITKQTEYEQQLRVLNMKRQEVYDDIQEKQQEYEAVRKDLALRTRACEEREKLLRVREVKVSQSEGQIQQNATLLNL